MYIHIFMYVVAFEQISLLYLEGTLYLSPYIVLIKEDRNDNRS
jgi:hypothetical protein